ncbi:MAG: M23 family metallopeptidase [Candidatus Dormibacteraeota bacterium]|nr:M23 family metallopeptidase [Candidatus Dormibacteraeota bacterium]
MRWWGGGIALAALLMLASLAALFFLAPVVLLAARPAAASSSAPPPAVPVSGAATPGNPLGPSCPHPPVSQPYGPTSFSLEPAAHGYAHFHTGIDLVCPYGTLIHNVDVAGVAHVFPVAASGGFGNEVVVEASTPAPGHVFIRYAHMSATAVQDGTPVQVGDLLGWEGSTGYSTGPHLHFEVDVGAMSVQDSTDPAGWLVL